MSNRERAERRRLEALRAASQARSLLATRRRELHTSGAAASIGPLTSRELFILGVGLYWAEGSKSKPYDTREQITFVNIDPLMIDVFLHWLQLLGVSTARCRFRVAIHETADVQAAERFWARVVVIPVEEFCRTTIKRHKPQTNRLNTGETYRGCLTISVLGSAALYRSVAGWWHGLHGQVAQTHRRSADWSDIPPWGSWQSRTPLER